MSTLLSYKTNECRQQEYGYTVLMGTHSWLESRRVARTPP